jgi:hypothetical protein
MPDLYLTSKGYKYMEDLMKKEDSDDPDSKYYKPGSEGLNDREYQDSSALEIIWYWHIDPASGGDESPTEIEFIGYHQNLDDKVFWERGTSDPTFVSDAKQAVRGLFEAGYLTIDRRQAAPQYNRRSTRRKRKGAFE